MCGIAGFFGSVPGGAPERILGAMLEAIQHRGPDGSGLTVFNQAGLGHVRLAVIDLAGGSQPMATPDGRFHISYNGELYNYREIRDTLLKQGYTIDSRSDTAVLLQAFAAFQVAALHSFRGMFAFALWDDQEKEGWLIRDRFGIKPLFYAMNPQGLVFASEMKALLPALPSRPEMNLNSLHQLMNFRYIPGSATMFTGFSHLQAGNILHWKNHRVRI